MRIGKWPWLSTLLTLAGMAIGVAWEGPADWLAGGLIALPLVILARNMHWAIRRKSD